MRKFIPLTSLLFVVLLISCASKSVTTKFIPSAAQIDSIDSTKIVMSDSIAEIINEADKIQCELLTKSDSITVDSIKTVPEQLVPVLKFLISDPDNFESNNIVYGLFSPAVKYTLVDNHNRSIDLYLDFGLKKWRLNDSTGATIFTADLGCTNLQLLRLSMMIFPGSKSLEILNNNLSAK